MNEAIFIDRVCKLFELDKDKLLSNHRGGLYPDARKMVAYTLYSRFKIKQKKIAELMHKKNHTVISLSIKRHDYFMQFDKKYKENYKALEVNIL